MHALVMVVVLVLVEVGFVVPNYTINRKRSHKTGFIPSALSNGNVKKRKKGKTTSISQ
jgi:hypothetical protein